MCTARAISRLGAGLAAQGAAPLTLDTYTTSEVLQRLKFKKQ